MSNQLKNPTFWCLVAFVVGMGLGIWGMIKADCSGPNCWVGSGFLKWAGGILIIAGGAGWALLSSNKRS